MLRQKFQETAYSVSWKKTKAGIPRGQRNGHSMSYLFYIVFSYRRGRQKEKDRNSCNTTEIHIFQAFCHSKKGNKFTTCRIHPHAPLYTCAKWELFLHRICFVWGWKLSGEKVLDTKKEWSRETEKIYFLCNEWLYKHTILVFQRLVVDGSSDSWKEKGFISICLPVLPGLISLVYFLAS